jgi:two-component system, LytTR family, response regulator
MAPIRTLIVDDEPPARQWLRTLCSRSGRLEVVGECATVDEAVRALRSHAVDLLLLDIRLGSRSGFQVLDGLAFADVPHLVFVTAHDEYAIRAFEHRAIDYLLKPVREDRFRETVARVQDSMGSRATADGRDAMPDVIGPLDRSLAIARGRGHATRLIAERAGAYRVIECATIVLIESDGNYIGVTERDEAAVASLRGTLQSVAAVLDPADFLRINRSTIVNLACVERIARDGEGRLVFRMNGVDRDLRVGRAYHRRVVERMKL